MSQPEQNQIYPIMEQTFENYEFNTGQKIDEWDDTGIYDQIIKKQNTKSARKVTIIEKNNKLGPQMQK